MLTVIKEIECYTVNIFKPPKKNQAAGRAPGAPVLDPPLKCTSILY